MKLQEVKKRTAEPQNIEYRMSKGGFASSFAFGYDPTGRSVFYKIDRSTKKAHDRRHALFDVRCWTFDVRPARNALETLWGKINQLIY